MTLAMLSLQFASLFEAAVLTRLLLWRWDHPFKDDKEFCNDLLEAATGALQMATEGGKLFDDLPAAETSLIAAIYYAEWAAVTAGEEDTDGRRQKWLDQFRAALPSCFCPLSDLTP